MKNILTLYFRHSSQDMKGHRNIFWTENDKSK